MSMSLTKVGGSATCEPLLGGDEQLMAREGAYSTPGHHGCLMEESKAYEALRDAGLIVSEFRRSGIDTLDIIPANSSRGGNLAARMCAYVTGIGFCTYDATHLEFMVPAGHVQKVCDGAGHYYFAGPGYHNIASMFWTKSGKPQPLRSHVKNGDRNILVEEKESDKTSPPRKLNYPSTSAGKVLIHRSELLGWGGRRCI